MTETLPGEQFIESARHQAELNALGGDKAMSLMKDVVEGKKVDNIKYDFDEKLVLAIHDKILWYTPKDARSVLREEDDSSTEVDTNPVVRGSIARRRFPLYGRWLSERVQELRESPEDLMLALRVAAEAHYGLTSTDLHPFPGGNGRTARILVNGILMLGTKELMEQGKAVPPVPSMRSHLTERGRIDPYVIALRQVHKTGTVNPLEKFIAEKWLTTLNRRMQEAGHMNKTSHKADLENIKKFEWRKALLARFVSREGLHLNEAHPVPTNYFTPRYVIV